jgi:hypothetical protein
MKRIALYLDEGRLARIRRVCEADVRRYMLVLELDGALGKLVLRLGWTPGTGSSGVF